MAAKYLQVYLFLLHFTLLHRYCTFLMYLKACGNPVSSQSIGAIYPTAFDHFMSLCHILIILTISQIFYCYMCYGDL